MSASSAFLSSWAAAEELLSSEHGISAVMNTIKHGTATVMDTIEVSIVCLVDNAAEGQLEEQSLTEGDNAVERDLEQQPCTEAENVAERDLEEQSLTEVDNAAECAFEKSEADLADLGRFVLAAPMTLARKARRSPVQYTPSAQSSSPPSTRRRVRSPSSHHSSLSATTLERGEDSV